MSMPIMPYIQNMWIYKGNVGYTIHLNQMYTHLTYTKGNQRIDHEIGH